MSDPSTANPFLGRDVGWLLREQAERRADAAALVWRDLDGGGRTWSYRSLHAEVEATAAGFLELGVEPGDRVCVHMGNRPEYVFSWFALLRLGAVMVATNTRSSRAELAHYLDRSGARMIVTDHELLDVARAASGARPLVVAGAAPAHVVPEGCTALGMVRRPGSDLDLPPVDCMAPAGIQFTSGTTSRPKGVVWTHANYLWGGRLSAANEGLRPEDVHLTYLPLFHTNAQTYSVMASFWAGCTVVLMPRFSASRFWPVAVEEGATWSSMIPFAIRALLDRPVPDHSFRCWGSGVAVRRWEEHFGVEMMCWWGMTETVTHSIVSESGFRARHRSMGRAAPGYELRLRRDDGSCSGAAGTGLLEVRGVRGVSMALGYLDDPASDADTWDQDGWMSTGDRVSLDDAGWFEFIEREKDMLKIGAENVAASEIEHVIRTVDGVADAAVVGRPDPMLDEVAVAFVVPAEAAEPAELEEVVLEACRRALADFKVPRAVFVVAELPRATLEKVAKAELRVWAAARSGGGRGG